MYFHLVISERMAFWPDRAVSAWSISSLAYLRLVLQYSDMSIIAHGVHFFVTLMLVLGLAILYNVTFEKGLNRILKNL